MKFSRVFAKRSRFAERLSYANVMATLAFFMALAGGAYAATQINGHDIKNHSIPVSKLVRGAAVPRALLADRVRQLVLTNGNYRRHRHHAADVVSASTTSSSSLITMSLGQTVPVLSVGPFTITARCFAPGVYNETAAIELDATANVDGWYARRATSVTGPPGERWRAGEVVPIWEAGAQGGDIVSIPYGQTEPGLPLLTPDGSIVTIGGTASWNQVSDCAVSLYAIT